MSLKTAVLSLAFLACAVPAYAADQAGGAAPHSALREACKADVDTLCKGVQPGGGRIKECLKANAGKVSQGCKTAMAEAKAAHQGAQTAPAPASGQ